MRHTALILASSLLLLSSCGRTDTAAGPLSGKAGPLYQIDLQVSNDVATASIHRDASTTFNAQSLTNAPEPVEIDFKSLVTSTFVAQQHGVDTRHIYTTMKVTNNTAQTIQNLIFLPVIRSDADNDPSNNTQTPSVPGTPFTNIRLYDGSDASAQATSIQLTQAKSVNPVTGLVSLNTSTSPYLTGLDTNQLTAAVSSDMKATVMSSGWFTADSLAPGASTNVTFAVDFPVDRSKPKTQPFAFSLLVTSAQDVTGSGIGASVDPAQLQGHIENWSLNTTGQFQGYMSFSGPLGKIGSDGTISGRLPTTLDNSWPLLNTDECTFDGHRTVNNVNVNLSDFTVTSQDDDRLGVLYENTRSGELVERMYSDQDAEFVGVENCYYYFLPPNVYDLKLKKGWNFILKKITSDGYITRTVDSTALTTWKFSPNRAEALLTFDADEGLVLKPGTSVQVPVHVM